MGLGTLYTSKRQASQSKGAARAWNYFQCLAESNLGAQVYSIQFDFGSQEWIAKLGALASGVVFKLYASNAEMANFK